MLHLDIDNSQISPPLRVPQHGPGIIFKCNTIGLTLWFYNVEKSPPTKLLDETSNILTIEQPSLKHSGYYFCHNPLLHSWKVFFKTPEKKFQYFVAIALLEVKGM